MAYRILEIGDVEGEFGPCGAGNVIVQAEVGIYNAQSGQTTNTMMTSGEQWSIEQADANLDEDVASGQLFTTRAQRIPPPHLTGLVTQIV